MPTEPPAQHRPPGIIDTVDLEYGLREVEADGDDAGHGSSLRSVERLQPYSLLKEGVVHAIKWAMQRCYMSLETLGSVSDTATVSLPAVAA